MSEAKRRRPRFYNLLQVFALSEGVPGETVEAGCFRGLSSYLLCHSMKTKDPTFTGVTHHIIDSFEGLGEPVDVDEVPAEAAGRFSDTSVEHVRRTLADFPDVDIVEGWIPDVFENLPEREYRFVHIDVDLYEPTRDCLRYFYPRVADGGFIVVDDFGPWPEGGRYPGCTRAVLEYCEQEGLTCAALSSGNAVLRKFDRRYLSSSITS